MTVEGVGERGTRRNRRRNQRRRRRRRRRRESYSKIDSPERKDDAGNMSKVIDFIRDKRALQKKRFSTK